MGRGVGDTRTRQGVQRCGSHLPHLRERPPRAPSAPSARSAPSAPSTSSAPSPRSETLRALRIPPRPPRPPPLRPPRPPRPPRPARPPRPPRPRPGHCVLMPRVHCIYSAGALRLFCGCFLCKIFVYKARTCSIAFECPSYGGEAGGERGWAGGGGGARAVVAGTHLFASSCRGGGAFFALLSWRGRRLTHFPVAGGCCEGYATRTRRCNNKKSRFGVHEAS